MSHFRSSNTRLRSLQTVSLGLCLAAPGAVLAATPNQSTAWLNQISLPAAVTTGTNGGAGVIIGIVDTGIVSTNTEVLGRVSALSSCAAVTFKCSNGVYDDNGHGTSVASIAAGNYSSTAIMSGVAPGVTIVAEKVLGPNGSGTDLDVANGINKAVAAGAQVINLSLTYGPSPTMIAAINNAAAKGAILVFAGGNDAVVLNGGANTNGLTAAVLSHLVFVGSVNSANKISSFSNTPGAGKAVAGTLSATYAALWVMAPGESIVAPGVQYGANAYGAWTGTSMAAPVVTGTLALLEKTWPILNRTGTATAVLFATTTDLGAAGVDNTYGHGVINVSRAFQPIGALSAVGPANRTIALGSSTSATVTSATLGVLQGLGSALANYTIFDSYSRNFTANLSTLVAKPSASPISLGSLVYTPVWTGGTKFADGGQLQMLTERAPAFGADHRAFGLASFSQHAPVNYVSYASPRGLNVSGGYGVSPGGAFFSEAMYGSTGVAGEAAARLGDAQALSALAEGGYSANLGMPLSSRLRLAVGWTGTDPQSETAVPYILRERRAEAASLGVAYQLSDTVQVGVTTTRLDERNGLLGASYTTGSALNFGPRHASFSLGATAVIQTGPGWALALDVAQATSPGQNITSGLLSRVGALRSLAYGVALSRRDLWAVGDTLSLSARRPLQLQSGTVDIAQTAVDSEGYNHTSIVRMNLSGGVVETNLALAYGRPLGVRSQLRGEMVWRANADQSPGRDGFGLRGVYQTRF